MLALPCRPQDHLLLQSPQEYEYRPFRNRDAYSISKDGRCNQGNNFSLGGTREKTGNGNIGDDQFSLKAW